MTCLHAAVIFASDAYLKLYAATALLAFSWKGCFLPYQSGVYWLEGCLLLVLLLLHLSCLVLSRVQLQLPSAALILPSIAAASYFMLWQQYVLRIEVITNSILILLQGLHAVTSFV